MNYYEELGIRSDADEEEIRKAHRRLVKIMHPDQHRDAGLKALAETQMRRLNSIVATLLDPEERREYDDQLRGGTDSLNAHEKSTWRSVPWWIASTLGAIVLTVGAVWFFADRLGSSFVTRNNPPKVEVTSDPATPMPAPTTATPVPETDNTTVARVSVPPPDPKPELPKAIIAEKRRSEAPKMAVVHAPIAVAIKREEKPKKFNGVTVMPVTAPPMNSNLASLRPPAAVGGGGGIDIPRTEYPPPPPPTAPSYNGHRDPLEGEWVYAPTEPEKRRAGLYPPEFIQLKLVKDTSGMHGEYSARYNVDRSVSPDVNFVLKATDPTAMKYQWTASNGAHGWLFIRDLETDTMRLEWKDTSKHNGQPSLTSGQATLVRKN